MANDWTYEELADEMSELVFFIGGRRQRWEELPRILRRILAMTPPGQEIILSELTASRWDVKCFRREDCPDDLRRIIEQVVLLDEIDFGRESLIVLGWEDPPGVWMHWPLANALSQPE